MSASEYVHVEVALEVKYRGADVIPQVIIEMDPYNQREARTVKIHGIVGLRQFLDSVEQIKRQAIIHGLYAEEE